MASGTIEPKQEKSGKALIYGAVVIIIGVLGTTLAQPQVLGRIPFQNLLKNELHVDRAANAAFFFWMGLAWYFKPFFGIITDAFPLFGSRRKSYMILGAALATLSWAGLYFTPHQYSKMLWVCIVINLFMMATSTVVGGYMVETAQAVSGSGRLTSVRNFVEQLSILITGPTAGFLASIAFGWTAGACACVMFLVVPGAAVFLREKRVHIDSKTLLDNAGKQLVKIANAKTMWAAAGFMALFYCAPGIATAVFYKQQNDLHLATEGQGFLQFLSGTFGVLAAFLYGAYACRRFNLRTLLMVCLAFGTAANLGYIFYSSVGNARIIESFNGFGYTLAEVAMMDLAVRATPSGSEGLGFALMMSVRNFTLFGSDWFGSKLLETTHIHFNTLVLANAATSVITVPLVLLLPAIIVNTKDAQPEPDFVSAASRTIQE
ncbi:MAG: MFS transporter [Candidatus Acidiferrales bacterium]